MISLFWKAVSINVRQFITDAKGILVNPEETLKEISERDKWGIPILLLIITSFIGLPGIFLFLIEKNEMSQSITFPLFGLPFFVVLLLVIIKILKKTGNSLTFLKLTGYLGIPYLLIVGLFCGLATGYLLVTHQCGVKIVASSSFNNSLLSVIILTILTILITIITIATIRLLIMAIKISFPSVSKKTAFLYFLFTLVLLNCILNIFIKPDYITKNLGSIFTWTNHTKRTIQTK